MSFGLQSTISISTAISLIKWAHVGPPCALHLWDLALALLVKIPTRSFCCIFNLDHKPSDAVAGYSVNSIPKISQNLFMFWFLTTSRGLDHDDRGLVSHDAYVP